MNMLNQLAPVQIGALAVAVVAVGWGFGPRVAAAVQAWRTARRLRGLTSVVIQGTVEQTLTPILTLRSHLVDLRAQIAQLRDADARTAGLAHCDGVDEALDALASHTEPLKAVQTVTGQIRAGDVDVDWDAERPRATDAERPRGTHADAS